MEEASRSLSRAYKWIDQLMASKDAQSNITLASEYVRQRYGLNDGTNSAPCGINTTPSRVGVQSPHMRMLTSVCNRAFGNIRSSRPSAVRRVSFSAIEGKPKITLNSDKHEKVNMTCSSNTVAVPKIQRTSTTSSIHLECDPDFAPYTESRMSRRTSQVNHAQPCKESDEEGDPPTLPDILRDGTNADKSRFASSNQRSLLPDDSKTLKGGESSERTHSNLGIVKMSIQYFSENRQLRVIIMSVEDLNMSDGALSVNISLNNSRGHKIYSTSNRNIVNKKVSFKQALFIGTESKLSDVSLKVAVVRSSRIFRLKKTLGVAFVPLDDLNLNFDTTLFVQLKPKQSRKHVSNAYS
ncbi:hypothetical protein DPMN_110928 [Dreissena polymorpha]|uniref:Uncharacterized protein n=1 Tax=Dreissena polymorpha TaxID=45954 RepID=A0A9D4KDI2_DREPO|nr:hypothetical protein DPMN_110928 [Dreissena polymorpha]